MDDNKEEYKKEIAEEYEQMRKDYFQQQKEKVLIPLSKTREKKLQINWNIEPITKPSFIGVKVIEEYDIQSLREFISWDPFF